MKKLLALFICMLFFSGIMPVSAKTEITIDTQKTTIGNMNIEIVDPSGERYTTILFYDLANSDAEIHRTGTIEDGRLFMEGLPFGNYQLKIFDQDGNESIYEITIDDRSVLKQHIPTVLIFPSKVQEGIHTGIDGSPGIFVWPIVLSTGTLMVLCLSKKMRFKDHE